MKHLPTIGVFIIVVLLSIIVIRPGLQSTEAVARNTIAKQKIIDRQKSKIIKEALARRTVLITGELTHDQHYLGSGTIVSTNGFILSAAHVVQLQSKDTMEIYLESGEKYTAHNTQVVDFDTKEDLLLLKLPDTNGKIFEASPVFKANAAGNLSSGDNLLLAGHAYGLDNTLVSECKFLVHISDENSQSVIWFDWFNAPGDSGGGLYNATAALVGVFHSVGGKEGFSRIGRAASNEVIHAFLKKNNVPYKTVDYSNL